MPLIKYILLGRRYHKDLRKENTIFQVTLNMLEDNTLSSSNGFNSTETGKDDFDLLDVIFKPEEFITFKKNHKTRNEILFFDLKFNPETKIYSGIWESNSFASKKKGESFILITQIHEKIDF